MRQEISYIAQETLEAKINQLENKLNTLQKEVDKEKRNNEVNIICFSGNYDKLYAALTIANGSLAMGMNVHLFFTFWSVSALRCRDKTNPSSKTFLQKMFNGILPCGLSAMPLSRFNMLGVGKYFMRKVMKKKGMDDIEALYDDVKELGGQIHLCDSSTELFGLKAEELITGKDTDVCGAATFLNQAFKSKMVLYI